MDIEKEVYYELVDVIKKNGNHREKRHGEYVSLDVYDDYSLELDTWNKSISVYKSGERIDNLGIDFGGFRCNIGMVNFWLAHVKIHSNQLVCKP